MYIISHYLYITSTSCTIRAHDNDLGSKIVPRLRGIGAILEHRCY